ncbi:MAG: hypothetical protein SPE00_08050 [Bacilli bacterium]|nr:hypothetical protein [Bacilli bacterium]
MKKNKLRFKKLSKKKITIILSILLIVILIIVLLSSREPYVGKIKDGKAVYIDRVKNVTVYPENKKTLIEFENNEELIDNCIISNEIYDKFKNNDPLYNITVKDYSKLSNLSAKENYNINKSLQLKLVKENDSYADYYAMTCGFKNKKELLSYTKAVIKLANKVK